MIMNRFLAFALGLLVFISACKQEESGDKKAELEKLKKQEATIKMKIAQLEKELGKPETAKKAVVVKQVVAAPFIHSIDIQGKVDGDQSVNISAEMPGTIMKVNVEPGAPVKKGQVLAELDNKVVAQGIQEVQSAKEFAYTMYMKQKNLWDQKIGTEVQYLSAKNQYESLEKKLSTMNQQLEMSRIKSPIDGTVDQVNIKVGQTTAPGMPAFAVVNLSRLKVKAELAESYVSKVKRGNDVIIQFPDLGTEVKSKVTYAGSVINSLNRTFNIEVDLGKVEDARPNMIAIIRLIDYQNMNAITVPAGVIQRSGDEQFVYVTESKDGKNIVSKKLVETGNTYNGVVEITSGLNQGDKLIVTGFQDLNPGDVVKI